MTFPELYILRHGETEWNAQNRMQGELNSALTAKGLTDAARQGEILGALDLDAFTFLCSPQMRAVQSAGIAFARVATDMIVVDGLREIGVGDWSGRLRDELPMPEGKDPFMAQYEIAPNGEGFERLETRCRAVLADLNGPSVLMTHGITSRMIRSIVAGQGAIAVATTHGGQGCVYHLKDGVQNLLV